MYEKKEITQRVQLPQIKLILIRKPGKGYECVQNLSRNQNAIIRGSYLIEDTHKAPLSPEEEEIPRLTSLKALKKLDDIDLIVYCDTKVPEALYRIAQEMKCSVVAGTAGDFLEELLCENSIAHQKQEELTRDFHDKVMRLSIQNELSQIIATNIEMESLLQSILSLYIKATNTHAGAIIMYDEIIKKFTISSACGLSEKFRQRIHLPLSDPIIEDLITIRREIAFSRIDEIRSSYLFDAASKDGMKSILALPLLTKEKLIGILCIFARKTREFSAQETGLLSTISGMVALAIENAQLYKSSREKQVLVEQLLSKLIFAQEEERKRIASEIHDSIAQTLVGILTKVQTSQSLLSLNPVKVADELEDLRKIVSESCKEIRQIIYNLRPTSLDDLGLVPSIENLIKKIEKESNIIIQLIVNEQVRRLPPLFETLAFRIIQEALTNVWKHSEAEKAWVELYFEPAQLSIKVVDNGKGFIWENVYHKFTEGDSFGLQSMKERAALVGGKVDILSEEDKGTTVSIDIPIDRSFARTFG